MAANKKYIVLIIVFTVLFFVEMVFCYEKYKEVSREYEPETLSYRKESVELFSGQMGDPADVYDNLYFAHGYEEAFDPYWEMAEARLTFIRARYGDEPSQDIQKLEAFVNTTSNQAYKKEVERYLEILKSE